MIFRRGCAKESELTSKTTTIEKRSKASFILNPKLNRETLKP
jgi:hypothetical protein